MFFREEAVKVDRAGMVDKLKMAGIRAVPTVATQDMGLQYDYITPEGAGTDFGGMGRWPLYKFHGIIADRWYAICDGINKGTLALEDLAGTGLDLMFATIYTPVDLDPAKVFEHLPQIDGTQPYYYCLFDTGMFYSPSRNPMFFNDEAAAAMAFFKEYGGHVTTWEQMSATEIRSWYVRLDDDLSAMHYKTFRQGK